MFEIPGVFEVPQNRSVKSRDSFIKAGITALNTMRFDDMKITEVAQASGNSVGSFYKQFRGIPHESYPRIMDKGDPWAPLRNHAQQVMRTLNESLRHSFPQFTPEETETRLSFCFQMVVGVLQNDLVNNFHVFKLEDGTVLPGLKTALRSYMALPAEPRSP